MLLRTRYETTTRASGQARARLAWAAALVLALVVAGSAGVGSPAGVGAFSGPCGGFDTQEQAQAAYDAGLLDPELVDYDGNGIACEGLPSGGTGPTDVGACGAYATQEDAQADFDAGILDWEQADYDGNGIACEGLPSAGTAIVAPVEAAEGAPAQPSFVGGSGDAPGGATTVTALPSTGAGQVVPVGDVQAETVALALLVSAAVASTMAGAAVLLWVRRTAA